MAPRRSAAASDGYLPETAAHASLACDMRESGGVLRACHMEADLAERRTATPRPRLCEPPRVAAIGHLVAVPLRKPRGVELWRAQELSERYAQRT